MTRAPGSRLDPAALDADLRRAFALVRWLGDEAARPPPTSAPTGASTLAAARCPVSRSSSRTRSRRAGQRPDPRASLLGPIEVIPALNESFDVVLCAQVLEHVDDPARGESASSIA